MLMQSAQYSHTLLRSLLSTHLYIIHQTALSFIWSIDNMEIVNMPVGSQGSPVEDGFDVSASDDGGSSISRKIFRIGNAVKPLGGVGGLSSAFFCPVCWENIWHVYTANRGDTEQTPPEGRRGGWEEGKGWRGDRRRRRRRKKRG